MKRDKTFMMFSESSHRFLLAATLIVNEDTEEFRISQDERFLEVSQTAQSRGLNSVSCPCCPISPAPTRFASIPCSITSRG